MPLLLGQEGCPEDEPREPPAPPRLLWLHTGTFDAGCVIWSLRGNYNAGRLGDLPRDQCIEWPYEFYGPGPFEIRCFDQVAYELTADPIVYLGPDSWEDYCEGEDPRRGH